MKGPCLCGDTECPWCGSAQGTFESPDVPPPIGVCDACGKETGNWALCDECEAQVQAMIHPEVRDPSVCRQCGYLDAECRCDALAG
jgi:hypothetical protein